MHWRIIKQFSIRNIFCFGIQDVTGAFPEKNRNHLAGILSDMVEMGMLCKISRDRYHIIPLNKDPNTYVPDQNLVAKYLMQNAAYYIGYASALMIHGIGSQTDHRVIVVTNKQRRPSKFNFGGIMYQFIQADVTRFFGFRSIWINHHEKAMVSDLEKTIVDIATRPQQCGGIVEVGSAIYQWNDRLDHDKLFYYFARNMNKSAKKRFLFLTYLLGLEWTTKHERMMLELGPGISLLDPAVPDQGKKLKRFGLKINVDPTHIKREVFERKIA